MISFSKIPLIERSVGFLNIAEILFSHCENIIGSFSTVQNLKLSGKSEFEIQYESIKRVKSIGFTRLID